MFSPQTNRALTGFSLAFYSLLIIPSSFNASLELRRAIVGVLGLTGTKMLSQLPTALCLLLCSAASTAASSLTTFSDANCQKSQTRIAGENGYPDGFCTNIAGVADSTYQSFMFTVLDEGCTRAFSFPSIVPYPVRAMSELCCWGDL